ncbi:bifunctional 2-polyprenyl-6-hydroxyphenol methylase/3-demethylubiquinol 3-O-methyltransferase UbiG [Ferruginibacter sp. HRS2-29]|uniref:class I SAM-dependent methyltransferase n=1 Tax=Ferruginibacter sp. HRS2-29 TaxID=2487334 RepID=UPI0020CD84E8|nr:class I SAM-dependent methyltransferase [Ferruginibacter sp. HRS2-29]MCP9751941.1 class I SAM-dependent methyltransferase [Ferruginibacter sp. HRS2-29]
MRTWEETIRYIRTLPEYAELVEKAYFEEDLAANVERFRKSEEFLQTLKLLRQYSPGAKSLLDIGSGNGISAIALALEGYEVTVSEPDPSDTVGAGAIRQLQAQYDIAGMKVYEQFAEDIDVEKASFDIVYVRQAMHHAYDLRQFIANLATLLKPGGFLFTIRDHVIYDEDDKERFLREHPLQKFYGGENAFTSAEYREAMEAAGLAVLQELSYYDSIINYFPMTHADIEKQKETKRLQFRSAFNTRVGAMRAIPGLFAVYKRKNRHLLELNEKDIAGRMYSYIAQKK